MNNEYVVAQIKEMLNLTEEDSITFRKFNKNNGLILDGCNIRIKGDAISPNIYFDINKPDDYIVNFIVSAYKNTKMERDTMKELSSRMSEIFKNKDLFLENVLPMLINKDNNAEMLEKVPHRDFLNLSIIYYVDVTHGTVKIHNEHIKSLGISEEDVYNAAISNLRKRPTRIQSLMDILKESGYPIPADEENDLAIAVTSEDRFRGSNRMLIDEVLEEVAEKIDDDYYIIPSSIHEFICIPKNKMDININELRSMVECVNTDEVSFEDVLSNSIYEYSNGELKEVM